MPNRKQDTPGPSVPGDTIVYGIGDVHGCSDLLDDLLEQIFADAANHEAARRVLVFVGDYIDRGPDSAGVIERLSGGMPESFETQCLMGNHEFILLQFLDQPETLTHWLINGGGETLRSYGIDAPDMGEGQEEFAFCRDAFVTILPETHRLFLETLPMTVKLGDYRFVHAGIRPGLPVEQQSEHDMLWIREGFLDFEGDFGEFIVHGHTPGLQPVERPNRICIDTGAYAHGCLTAVRLVSDEREFMSARQ